MVESNIYHNLKKRKFPGAIDGKHVIYYIAQPLFLSLIFLGLFCPENSSGFTHQVRIQSYDSACKAFRLLLKTASPSESALNNIASTFVDLQKTERGAKKTFCRFYAGKAYLNLYKLSPDPKYLDISIKNFNDFKKSRSNSKYFKEALLDLKEAYLLKRKSNYRKNSRLCRVSPPTRIECKMTNPGTRNLVQKTQQGLSPETDSSQTINERTPVNPVGNPFFRAESCNAQSVPQRTDIKTASIPPPIITEVKPNSDLQNPVCHTNGPVIVIDPGHGGKDPGAVSSDGKITEKEIVLEIAKRLKKRLEKIRPDAKVYLTRNDDSFLSLKERAKIANSLNAEVFISVHCNGSDFKSASGPEIFYLSKSSSRGAMRAAARENGVSLSKMNDLEATLVDLLTTSKNSESNKLAGVIHDSLIASDTRSGIKFRDRGIKQAPFYVLIGATMPAVLVECGFINNIAQKDLSSREKFIRSIADKLASGTAEYVKKLPAS
ncbi:MAG: N-acetylmuramoyl-L-alanine amidase [Deltaproteobacteria bacterium]|nr:N-acetylmuramoyl-L-alanine amidase [Deltaproteobacteria bacterium]